MSNRKNLMQKRKRDSQRQPMGDVFENRGITRGGEGEKGPSMIQEVTPVPAYDLEMLKKKTISELTQLAQEMGLENIGNLRKQELIFSIIQKLESENREREFIAEGVLEILSDGFGFLRAPITITYPVQMTFTCHPRRFVGSTCGLAIQFLDRYVLLKTASAISLC